MLHKKWTHKQFFAQSHCATQSFNIYTIELKQIKCQQKINTQIVRKIPLDTFIQRFPGYIYTIELK